MSRISVTTNALGHDWKADPYNCSRCHLVAETKTIYFQNNWKWAVPHVYIYYTDANGDAWDTNAFPGVAMTKHGEDGTYDIYKVLIPTHATAFLFNDGKSAESAGHQQSVDVFLNQANDGYVYSMVWDGDDSNGKDNVASAKYVEGYKTIYFQNNWKWINPYVYYFYTGANGTWDEAGFPGFTLVFPLKPMLKPPIPKQRPKAISSNRP